MLTTQKERLYYRQDIDGLRAISIIAVVAFHLYPEIFPAGFLGVDIFYVISGYLITGLLLKEAEGGSIQFGEFWKRRIKRLFPAFFVVALATALIAVLSLPLSMAKRTGGDIIAATIGASNWYYYSGMQDYWAPAGEWFPFLHTWSLSVEEQFYLIFPMAFWGMLRVLGPRRLTLAFVALVLAMMALSRHHNSNPSGVFFLPHCRAWELLVGSLAAVMSFPQEIRRIQFGAHWSGLVVILSALSIPLVGNFTPVPGATLATAGAFFVCWAGDPALTIRSPLSLNVFARIGRASYSLYLWHWPALVFGSVLSLVWPAMHMRELCLLAGLGAGFASHAYVEPLGRRPGFLRIHAPLMLGLLIAISLALHQLPTRRPLSVPHDAAGANVGATASPPSRDSAPHHEGRREPAVFLIGDSHAVRLSLPLRDLCEISGYRFFKHVINGDALLPGASASDESRMLRWSTSDTQREDFIRSTKIDHLVVACRWEHYSSPAEATETEAKLLRWKEVNPGMRITIVTQPPVLDVGCFAPQELTEWYGFIGVNKGIRMKESDERIAANIRLAQICQNNGFQIVDSESALRAGGLGVCPQAFYTDGNHLSGHGSSVLAKAIKDRLDSLASQVIAK